MKKFGFASLSLFVTYLPLGVVTAFTLLHAETQQFWALPDCGNDPHLMQVRARHLEGSGVGFSEGYSSVDAFIPFYNSRSLLSFFDVRGHAFNNGRWAANGGVGLRGMAANTIFGINAFYDFRKTNRFHYHQIGGGLEALGDLWEVRLNGYFPVGKHQHCFDEKFYEFRGNRALFREKCEFSFIGTDLEVGAQVFKTKYVDMMAFLDGYFFSGKFDKQAWGGMAKLRLGLTPYISVQGNVSYDSLFKWRGNGELSLNFPFGGRKKINPCQIGLERRFVEPVDRFEIIVEKRARKTEVALDPNNRPFRFIFVDNVRGSSDGSFEHPFISLLEAQENSAPGDVIYVFTGDGTTNHMNQGISLQDNQYFIGSDFAFTVNTSSGTINIPAQTDTPPVITNILGDGVLLANNNQVSGFQINQTLNNGIAGTSIAGAKITNNLITNSNTSVTSGFGGINITGPGLSGTFVIEQNLIAGGNSGNMQGIIVTPRSTDVCTVNITQNFISTFRNGMQLQTFDTSKMFASVLQNFVNCTDSDPGLALEANQNSEVNYAISNNSFSSALDTALLMQGRNSSTLSGFVTANEFVNSPTGFHIAVGPSTVTSNVTQNFFSNNSIFDFEAEDSTSGGYLCLSLIANTAPTFGYNLNNFGPARVFNLSQFSKNIGPLATTGTVTDLRECPSP